MHEGPKAQERNSSGLWKQTQTWLPTPARLRISLNTPQIHLRSHRPRDGLWLPFQQIYLQMVCCSEIKPDLL